MSEDELYHFGVLGMKWGRRKSRSKSSGVKKSSSKKKTSKTSLKSKVKKTLSKVDKNKVKSIAKTTAVVTGSVLATAAFGYIGNMAFREITSAMNANSYYDSSGNKQFYTSKGHRETTSKINGNEYSTILDTRDRQDGSTALISKIRKKN